MILWRVSNCQSLDGVGGLYVSGRWHTKSHPVVYCTLNPATALLETLVHIEIDSEDRPARFQVLRIEGPEPLSIEKVEAGSLSPNWVEDINATQAIGDRWLSEKRSLLLQVPSVLVPETWNVLVNPLHVEISLLKIMQCMSTPSTPACSNLRDAVLKRSLACDMQCNSQNTRKSNRRIPVRIKFCGVSTGVSLNNIPLSLLFSIGMNPWGATKTTLS